MNNTNLSIYNGEWERTALGTHFLNLGFHMFTIDQLLSTYEDAGEDVIRMTLGKSDQPLSSDVKNAMKRVLDSPKDILRVDSEGNPLLRKEIAKQYSFRFGTNISENNVIIGSQGTSSLYRDIFIMLLQNGGRVLLPRPGYILYDAAAKLMKALRNDIEIDYYSIDLQTSKIDLESFRYAFDINQTRIVVVNSPGNPLGNMISYNEWESIIEIVNGNNNAVLLSDQVYGNMVFGEKSYVSILDQGLREKLKRPYIVTDSMSKGFEMYTFRVGFAIVPDDIMPPLIAFQRNFSLTPNTIAQFGAIQAIRQTESVRKLCALYENRYQNALAKFSRLGDIHVCPVSGGFYMLICCQNFIDNFHLGNDYNLAMEIAKNTNPHVGVTPGSDFGAPGCLRISFSPKRFTEGIDLLLEYFSTVVV